VHAHKESIQAMDALANLINLEPGKLALPSEKPGVIPIWPLSRGESIQQALERREELRADALGIQALRSDARAIRQKVLPALALSGQVQRTNLTQQGGSFTDNLPGSLTRTSGYTTFVGLTFDWKLLDGGIRQAEASATDAKTRQAQAQREQNRLSITNEVADAYAGLVASKILVDAARVDVEASRRSLQAAISNYEAGLHNDEGTTVVQSIQKLQTALNTYRNLVASQNTSTYRLYRYTATWPMGSENLVKTQYQQWLAPPASPPLPAVKP
jgi:outer membrane protein TolC